MVVSMDRWSGKVAIVTGVTAGIGLAIAEQLVQHGVIVAGLARRKDRLDKLTRNLSAKKGKFHGVKCDISKEEEILEAFEWVKTNLGPISILVNNAGIAGSKSLTKSDTTLMKIILDTNVLGLCVCTREAVRNMKENNVDGHIVHINSTAGHKVPNIEFMGVYPASKHAVTALTETLRQELNREKLKIKITSVSPGAVATEIGQAAGIETGSIGEIPTLEADDVADAVTYVLSTPPHVQIHELIVKPVGETL